MEENKGLMTEFNSYVVENNPSPIMARVGEDFAVSPLVLLFLETENQKLFCFHISENVGYRRHKDLASTHLKNLNEFHIQEKGEGEDCETLPSIFLGTKNRELGTTSTLIHPNSKAENELFCATQTPTLGSADYT
jgi:hypothetical protein